MLPNRFVALVADSLEIDRQISNQELCRKALLPGCLERKPKNLA